MKLLSSGYCTQSIYTFFKIKTTKMSAVTRQVTPMRLSGLINHKYIDIKNIYIKIT